MSDPKKAVPEPNEAGRDDDIHYHQVDETNVGEAEQIPEERVDRANRSEPDE